MTLKVSSATGTMYAVAHLP